MLSLLVVEVMDLQQLIIEQKNIKLQTWPSLKKVGLEEEILGAIQQLSDQILCMMKMQSSMNLE